MSARDVEAEDRKLIAALGELNTGAPEPPKSVSAEDHAKIVQNLADCANKLAAARTRTDPTFEEIVVEVAGRKVADVLACMLRTGLYGPDLQTIVREAIQRTAREYLTSGLPRPSDGKPKHVSMPRPPIEDPFGGR